MTLPPECAEYIVDGIIEDLCDRNGLSDVWHTIDATTQQEIREAWILIVMNFGG